MMTTSSLLKEKKSKWVVKGTYSMSKFIEKISGSIEKTVTELNEKDFSVDPIAGTHFSKIVSVMSSAYKRHGFILEKSILERVKESEDFEAWEEKVFNVNRATENALNEIDPADRRTYNKDLNIEYYFLGIFKRHSLLNNSSFLSYFIFKRGELWIYFLGEFVCSFPIITKILPWDTFGHSYRMLIIEISASLRFFPASSFVPPPPPPPPQREASLLPEPSNITSTPPGNVFAGKLL